MDLSFHIRDHPLKTSACSRGGGVKNLINLLTDSTKIVLSSPIFLKCRSAPDPYQKKEWHSHIAPFEKREWHSLIALSWKECTLLSLLFFVFFFLPSIHTWIWKVTRNYLCFQRNDGVMFIYWKRMSEKKKLQKKSSPKPAKIAKLSLR